MDQSWRADRIHPSEFDCSKYTLEYDRAIRAFDKLRNDEKIETFGSNVEFALAYGEYRSALDILVKRPGELARRLDQLLRVTTSNKADPDADGSNVSDLAGREQERSYKESVISAFASVADRVSTPVLLQVREHFAHRSEKLDSRVFFPKGSLAKCHCEANKLPDIEEQYCRSVVEICEKALVKAYGQRAPMGKVYLSENYRNYVVPFSQRSAGKATKTIVRGSRLQVQKHTKAIRAFIWWTNMDGCDFKDDGYGRVDIDLSAAIFDENWNYMEHVSYTRLRSSKYKACHSGDIINGGPVDGDGVSEFLDVNIDSVRRCGARYVAYQLYCYTGQDYADMPHAMFGWMERADVKSGEIYEPKTVEQKMDLTAKSTVCIPVIFDCLTREVVWCDMNLSIGGCHCHAGGNNLESNLSGVAAVCYAITNMKKPDLYDLIALNVRGRGEFVTNRDEADIVFDIENGVGRNTDHDEGSQTIITPFDTEVFMGEYL